jgi:PIN domain nuclease of toxin-antitoxin system
MRTINMHAAKTQLSRRAWSRPPHRDPFDRVLVAQAIVEPAILHTADQQLVPYSDLVRHIAAD